MPKRKFIQLISKKGSCHFTYIKDKLREAADCGVTHCCLLCVTCFTLLSLAVPVENMKVYPAILGERSSTKKVLLKIREDLVLNLERSSVFSNTFQFITHTGESKITHHINASDIEGKLYHDTEKDAAIMITHDDDGLRVEGILSDTLRIRPSYVSGRNADGHIAQEIFYVSLRHSGEDDAVKSQDASTSWSRSITTQSKSRSGIYATVSPEVHVLIDSAHTKNFKTPTKIMEYIAIFIACVNLKFRTLLYVDVQIVVTKITTFHDNMEPFIVRSEAHPTIMMGETLWNFSNYVKEIDETISDDMAVLLTGMDIAYVNIHTGTVYGQGTSGLANPGGACGLWTRGALVEDVAKTFDGVTTFAHECGHLLGMSHDGSPPPKPGPGVPNCPAEERYIMSPFADYKSKYKFSYCSAVQLYTFVSDPTRTCLQNVPDRHAAKVTLERLKKALVSPQKLCKLEYPNHPVIHYVETNSQLNPALGMATCHVVCHVPEKGHLTSIAPDGMPCDKNDPNKVCINKECVTFPPDITTITKRPQKPN
ncbi:snake venom metalloproteinase H3-like [Ixodes scapularis]|uniref:snake venom metalloproteinase H3-like n=1 Tax=Ixodes scapularis TaxID=6945 RepID=UPI001C38D2B8|nr:snake venom metalloproteinase H3-like [Ixodes scapularis]